MNRLNLKLAYLIVQLLALKAALKQEKASRQKNDGVLNAESMTFELHV
jgi:hypothetical protein